MPSITISGTLTYGDTTSTGAVARRIPLEFSLEYTEESVKTVLVAAGATDSVINLDSVGSPSFVFIQSVETDVTIKLSDGVVADPTPTALKANSGWIMIANSDGQDINRILVTTPASPTSGARVQILAFE